MGRSRKGLSVVAMFLMAIFGVVMAIILGIVILGLGNKFILPFFG